MSGYTKGRPFEVRYEIAAKVGNFAINLIAVISLYLALLMSRFSWKKEESAPTTPHIIAIGWAFDS